ncbi:MAG TPA: carbohydrate ABC transporter permease [Aggregatilineales bacterium]|jgi:ABC-type glycerol-3-phosphate transport system permease component|nr:carbohydrate ABC transporter permease [Aggregatilineales bacterium]
MKNTRTFNLLAYGTLTLIIALLIAQVAILFIMAGKDPSQMLTSPLLPTLPYNWENFSRAWNLGIKNYMGNSIFLSLTIVAGDITLSVVTAYVFARYQFPGKAVLFASILALMMVPGILTLVPRYLLIRDLKLLDTYWAVILPAVLGANAFQIIVMRTFFQTLPEELFESARIDGAGHLTLLRKITLPLSIPIISSMAILRFNGAWNDLIWPLLVLNRDELRPVSVGLVMLSTSASAPQIGVQMAGSVIAAIPMIIIFLIGMRAFIDGLSTGAIKM